MKLVSVDGLKVGIGASDGNDELLETVLRQITLALESLLNTRFSKGTQVTDIFHVDPLAVSYLSEAPKLVLSRGFIDLTPPVLPNTTPPLSIVMATDFASRASGVTVDLSSVVVDSEKGHLLLMGGTYGYKYVFVTYNYGLDTTPDDADVESPGAVYVGVPQWLRSAVMSWGYESFQAMRQWTNDMRMDGYQIKSGNRAAITTTPTMIPAVSGGVSAILAPYIRDTPLGIYPLN